VIVRWSLDELPAVLDELGPGPPFVVASSRWHRLETFPVAGAWRQVPSDRVEVPAAAGSLLAIGGGSAIDTAKAASASTGLPLVCVPTTYSGAEWPPSFGIRTPDRRIVGGGGGSNTVAIVYDVRLTLELPRAVTVGTALNALAHCAEALYASRAGKRSDALAIEGAGLIERWLPSVVEAPNDVEARDGLLHGAAAAGEALALAGYGLAHAMAQALGGGYGLPHGAMNALTLAPALRFNAEIVPEQVGRFGAAIGAGADPASRVEELARLGGYRRLSFFGIPEGALAEIAEAAAGRTANRGNPRPATPAEIEALLRSIF
jgi:maleylacetate reductase